MTTVAKAVLEITTDGSGVDAGLNKVRSATAGLRGDLTSLAGTMGIAFSGAAVVSGLKTLVSNTFAYAENITDLAARMDVSTEAAQRWKYAADQSGSSIETFAKGATNLTKELAGGGSSVQAALKSAGLELSAIRSMKPEDAFNATVAAIAKMPDPLQQVKVGTELFGKAWIEMAPAIRDGAFEAANGISIMSKQTIKDLDDAKQSWDNLGNSITIATGSVISWIGKLGEAVGNRLNRDLVLVREGAEALKRYDEAAAMLARSNAAGAKAADDAAEAQRKKARADADGAAKAEAAAAANQRLADAFQKQVDVLTGKALSREVAELAKQVAAAEKQGGLSAFQYKELGKRLDEMVAKGVVLPLRLQNIRLEHERLNPSIKLNTEAYKMLEQSMNWMNTVGPLKPPPPLSIPVTPMTPADWTRVLSLGAIGPLAAPPAQRFAETFSDVLGRGLSDLPGVILGAIQGGGSVGGAIGSSLGSMLFGAGSPINNLLNSGISSLATRVGGTFAAQLGSSLSLAIPGIGALLGPAIGSLLGTVGGWIGGVFGGNDTKKMREQFAREMGLSLDGLYNKLRQYGAEGDVLVNQALNVIGKGDKAAQQRWFAAVDALLAKQKDAADEAATAVEDAAQREVDAHNAATDAIKEKISALDEEIKSLESSIADEAWEEEMGVVEAETRRLIEQRKSEREAAEAELAATAQQADLTLEATSKKVLGEAELIREGIASIFREPFPVTFNFSGLDGLGNQLPLPGLPRPQMPSFRTASFPGATRSRPIQLVIQNQMNVDGRSLWRNQRQYATEALERG